MNTWKVILATIVIFAAGAFTGAVLVRHAEPERFGAGGMRMEFLRRMERDLDLTSEQRERIDRILKDGQEHTRKAMEPVAPAVHAELQRTKDEFRSVLTPAQQARFDELLRRPSRGREGHHGGGAERTSSANTNAAQTNSVLH